jgi:hypothetical protein
LVKNLISVHSLTRDNNITIEFDPLGFSIKDIPPRRCSSDVTALATSTPWRRHHLHRKRPWPPVSASRHLAL